MSHLLHLDLEIEHQRELLKHLEAEVCRAEMMSDRVVIRKDIHECKNTLKELLEMKKDGDDSGGGG